MRVSDICQLAGIRSCAYTRKDCFMTKKTQYLKPDTILKNYWNDNEHFADLFNAVLFDGKQVIKATELTDLNTESSSVLEHKNYAESIVASRDSIKARKKSTIYGIELVLLGREDQDHIHYAMPMRNMGYDYGTYKKQYDSNAKKYKTSEGLSEDEYLSKMKKSDRFYPVITLTVYYGEKPWDGPTSLHEMLDIPKELEPFVNDYKILLVEARRNNLMLHNLENIDLFNLFEIALNEHLSKNMARQKAIQYCEEHNTDKSVIMTFAGAANIHIDYNALNKGDGTMYSIFEDLVKEGEAKGETRGEAKGIIETGFDFGLSTEDILERLQQKLNISLQQAQEYLNTFAKQSI